MPLPSLLVLLVIALSAAVVVLLALLVSRYRAGTRKAAQTIRHLAYHDALTGLPNRLLFADRVRMAMAHAARNNEKIAALFLDLDHFKTVNDTLGHDVGDDLLRQAAQRLLACLRASDTVARQGGDEFMVLLQKISTPEDAVAAAQRILDSLRPPIVAQGHELHVTASVGIAIFPDDGDQPETLFKNADIAMYNSKEAGRNQLHLFNSEMNRRIAEMMDMKNRLARGLEHDQFFLLFQPQIDLRSHRLAGLEAFIRWRDPEKGPVSPLTFLRVAEETGLIVPLGTWILKTACRQARTWQDAGLPPVRITVNLSARQFRAPGFVESVTEILGQNRLPPHLLGLEIKEATSARELDFVLRSLRRLKALGLHIALDDFGTGTSSLGFLRSFPFDAVKIDVSLLHETSTSEAGRLLVQSIIAAGHGLNLEVAAEGVESREQLDFVTRSGCDLAQGYLLAKPLPADQIHPLLTKQSWT